MHWRCSHHISAAASNCHSTGNPLNILAFNALLPRRLVCESGASHRVGNLAEELLDGRKHRAGPAKLHRCAFVVSDPGVRNAGLTEGVVASIEASGMRCVVYDAVSSDPAEHEVMAGAQVALASSADCVVGVGGGSALDVAKMVSLLASEANEQRLEHMYGVDKVVGQRLPLLLMPTTAGTGSEATQIAILTTS
eukprot:2795832-Pleurochrysis_carterae.AAC.2